MLAILLFLTWDDILHIIVYLHFRYATYLSYSVFKVHVYVVLSLHNL